MSSTSPPHKAPNGFGIRHAKVEDADAMAQLFYTSFALAHPFYSVMMPKEAGLPWWETAWKMGMKEDPTTRTFVVEDCFSDGTLVAFSRWVVPQHDGNLHRLWPERPPQFDHEICKALFDGVDRNRKELMGIRPHWVLEVLGVDEKYQKSGVGSALMDWGIRQADQDGLELYLDASMKGLPFYLKRGFEIGKVVDLPERPAYGKFVNTSLIRKPVRAFRQ